MDREQLRRERFVLADDRRQIEQPEEGCRCAIGGIGDVAHDRHGEQQDIERRVHDRGNGLLPGLDVRIGDGRAHGKPIDQAQDHQDQDQDAERLVEIVEQVLGRPLATRVIAIATGAVVRTQTAISQ